MFDGRDLKITTGTDGSILITGLEAAVLGQINPELRRQLRGLHKAYDKLRMERDEAYRINRTLRLRLEAANDLVRQRTKQHIVRDITATFDYVDQIQVFQLTGRCPECSHAVIGHFTKNGQVSEDDCTCARCGNYLIWDERGLLPNKKEVTQ